MKILCIALIYCISSGCTTLVVRSYDSSGFLHFPGIYPATRFDAEIIGSFTKSSSHALVAAGAVIDTPFSLTFDTLLVPYDYFKEQ